MAGWQIRISRKHSLFKIVFSPAYNIAVIDHRKVEPRKVKTALKKIFSGIDELKGLFPQKNFTVDGRLVGDIGEMLAFRDYEITLYQRLSPKHDGETLAGKKVQIKATFKNSLTFKNIPEYYLGIKLNQNGTYEEIFNGPGQIIARRYKYKKNFGKVAFSIPISTLKDLITKVEDKVARRQT